MTRQAAYTAGEHVVEALGQPPLANPYDHVAMPADEPTGGDSVGVGDPMGVVVLERLAVGLLLMIVSVPVAHAVGVPVAHAVGVPVAHAVGVPVALAVGVPVAHAVALPVTVAETEPPMEIVPRAEGVCVQLGVAVAVGEGEIDGEGVTEGGKQEINRTVA